MKIPSWAISIIVRILWRWIFKEDFLPYDPEEEPPIPEDLEKTVENHLH